MPRELELTLNQALRPVVSAKQAKGLKLQFGSTVATLEERDHFLLVSVGKDLA